jgi:F-type H+-transporting ATPase subunit epsilon
MANPELPQKLLLEIVTPAKLVLREEVDAVQAPGKEGSFGVLPGHTPFFSTLGLGEITYRQGGRESTLTCFWGFCEVLPDRVTILADLGERAEEIDVARAEEARAKAATLLKEVKEEAGYREAHEAYSRAVTRLAVARRRRE